MAIQTKIIQLLKQFGKFQSTLKFSFRTTLKLDHLCKDWRIWNFTSLVSETEHLIRRSKLWKIENKQK